MTNINKIKKYVIMIALIYIILSLVMLPKECISAAQKAIRLCLDVVIPSLFPFFAASSLFISLGFANYLSRFFSGVMRPVFNVSGSGALSMILGIISGYPIGAATSVKLYQSGYISKSEAERLLGFTNNSGPLFVLGALGIGMLSSPLNGFILYISHILAAFLTGILFRFYGKNSHSDSASSLPPAADNNFKTLGEAIGEAINFSVDNMLKVCGFVVIFSVICSFIPSGKFHPYIYSLIEITGGLNNISALNIDESFKLSLISFFLSFSGLSVMCQVSSFVISAGLSMKPYILGKFLQGIFSFYITRILLNHFTPYRQVSTILSPIYKNVLPENLWHASLSIILFTLFLLIFILLIGFFLEKAQKK